KPSCPEWGTPGSNPGVSASAFPIHSVRKDRGRPAGSHGQAFQGRTDSTRPSRRLSPLQTAAAPSPLLQLAEFRLVGAGVAVGQKSGLLHPGIAARAPGEGAELRVERVEVS